MKKREATSEILFTDASCHAYGGYLLKSLGNIISHGRFTSTEKTLSSTHRELLAVKNSLLSFKKLLTHESVSVRTDNFATSRILEIGSSKEHLQKIAIDIFNTCVQYDIRISPTWVPREQNKVADYYSKIIDTDNWSIDDVSFSNICSQLGWCDFDRFADNLNARCSKFNSKYYCVGTHGVDAFTQDWSSASLNWLSPPISLIIPSIIHCRRCRCKSILIVPHWTSSYFFPVIHEGMRSESFNKKCVYFNSYFKRNSQSTTFNASARLTMMALLIEF